MTLPEAIAYANELDWSIYHLGQIWLADGHPNDSWECTLRRMVGGPRRDIARGVGEGAEDAIMAALAAAPELESEVNVVISDNIAIASGDGIPDLLALIGYRSNLKPTRTRS